MIETGSHTVLVFVKLQFLQQWSRLNGAEGITYTVTGKAGELLVEDKPLGGLGGVFVFNGDEGHEVWVFDDVAHVPAL